MTKIFPEPQPTTSIKIAIKSRKNRDIKLLKTNRIHPTTLLEEEEEKSSLPAIN